MKVEGPRRSCEIDGRRHHQVGPVQPGRRQADHEAHRLVDLGQIAPLEVFFEGHLARHEVQQGGAHAQGRRGGGGNAQFGAQGEGALADIEGKEIERIDIQVDAGQEFRQVVLVDPLAKKS
jgi:hypothetical protein